MISKKSKGFCPKPLKSPDPDRHNRSAIISTASPDFRQQTSEDEISSQFLELKRENTILKKELERMRVSDVTVKKQPYQAKIYELQAEIRKMRETIRLLSNDNGLQQQNSILLKKVDELLTQNSSLKEDIKELYKLEKFINEQFQFIEMRLQDRENRLEKAQSYINHLRSEKAKPRGDTGPLEDEQMMRPYATRQEVTRAQTTRSQTTRPQITRLQMPTAQIQQRYRNLSQRLNSQQKYMQELLKIDKNKDNEINELLKSLRQKDHEIFNLRNTNKILDQRSSIVRSQLQQIYTKLQQKQIQLESKTIELNMIKMELQGKRVEIQQFKDYEPSKDYEIERLRRQIRELSRIIEARRQNKDSGTQEQSLKKYILTLNDTMEADRRKIMNLQSQNEHLRAAASTSVSEAIKNETISTLQKQLLDFRQQSHETLSRQKKLSEQLQKQLRNCQSIKTQMSYRMNQLISENNLANAALIRQRSRFENEMQKCRRLESEVLTLRQEIIITRASQERKSCQLHEVVNQLTKTKETLLSINIDDVESRIESRFKQKQSKIKISVAQKDTLKKQYNKLTQQVVVMKEEITKMQHQRNIMAAEIDRINYEKQILDKNSHDLASLIKEYVESYTLPKAEDNSHSALQSQIYRQIMELSVNTDLTSLKLSLKRMEQTVERVRLQLQKIEHS